MAIGILDVIPEFGEWQDLQAEHDQTVKLYKEQLDLYRRCSALQDEQAQVQLELLGEAIKGYKAAIKLGLGILLSISKKDVRTQVFLPYDEEQLLDMQAQFRKMGENVKQLEEQYEDYMRGCGTGSEAG